MSSFLYLAPAPLPLADDGGEFEAKCEEKAKSAVFLSILILRRHLQVVVKEFKM